MEIEIKDGFIEYPDVVGVDLKYQYRHVLGFNVNRDAYSVIGGHADGQDAYEAIIREIKEETGILTTKPELKPLDWHIRIKSKIAQPFIFNSEKKLTPQEGDEITKFVYLSDEQLNDFLKTNNIEPFSKVFYESLRNSI